MEERAPAGRAGLDPLWRKAPLAMLRHPGLFVALAVGALLLAASAAAFPLFTSATAGSLVDEGIARPSSTRYGAGMLYGTDQLQLGWQVSTAQGVQQFYDRIGELFGQAAARSPYLAPVVEGVMAPELEVAATGVPGNVRPGRLFASTDVLDHVQIVAGRDGPGVWLPQLIASALEVGPGDRIVLTSEKGRSATVAVDGIYRDLFPRPLPGYWLAWDTELIQLDPDAPPLPQPILADRDQLLSLLKELRIRTASFSWQAPLRPGLRLTLDQARAQVAFTQRFRDRISSRTTDVGRLFGCCRSTFGWSRSTRFTTYLPDVVRDVEQRLPAIQGPGRLVQTAGVAVALLVVAGAGAFALATRKSEAGLMIARGTGPLAVAARSCVESVLPCAVGGVAGLVATFALLRSVGPPGAVSADAIRSAVLGGVGAVAVSIGLLGLVAAVWYLRGSEHHRARLAVLGAVPWELGLLALAYVAWQRLDEGGALVGNPSLGTQRPSRLLVVFPLLLLAGAGLLGARLFSALARGARGRSGRLGGSTYLAIHRLAGGPRLVVALVAGAALTLGIFVQSQAMVRSLRSTVDAKAGVYVGADVQARVDYGNIPPEGFPFPMTRVVRFPAAGTLSTGGSFDLLTVDPATLAAAAYWNHAFADVSLSSLVGRLVDRAEGPLPVIAAGSVPAGITAIDVDQEVMPVRVVGTASAFPGMLSLRPLIVVDEQAFLAAFHGTFNPLDVSQATTELWFRGDERAIQRAIPDLGFPTGLVLTVSQVKDIPSITAVIDTFVVLNLLGLAAALLVIVAMLMYLQARERSQVVSYGLSLRMGMTHGGHRRALVSELAAMLGSSYLVGAVLATLVAALIVPLLDPLSTIPPGPVLVTPALVIGLAAVVIGAVAWAGGWLTNRRARRVDLGEVMRLAE